MREHEQPEAEQHRVEAGPAKGSCSASAAAKSSPASPSSAARRSPTCSIASAMSLATTCPRSPTRSVIARQQARAAGQIEHVFARLQRRFVEQRAEVGPQVGALVVVFGNAVETRVPAP